VQDNRLKFIKVRTYIRASEEQEKLKDLVEDLKECQPSEVEVHLEVAED